MYTVEKDARIRLTHKELCDGVLVPWLKPGEKAHRMAVLTEGGGVSVLPPEEVEAALARLLSEGPLRTDASARRKAYHRYLGLRWMLTFTWSDSHFSVTLPAGARRLGLLPDIKEAAAVCVSGSVFEIWHGDALLADLGSRGISVEEIRDTDDLDGAA